MDKLKDFFDKYSVNARVKPSLLMVLPLIIVVIAWYPLSRSMLSAAFGVALTFGVVAFLANYVASTGRAKESSLFNEWGGMPSSILLSHSDDIIDIYSKQRYHAWLNSKLAEFMLPSSEEEIENKKDAIQRYDSASRLLREKTRDKDQYPLVFAESINYGFSRNLWAVKPIGTCITLIALAVNSIFLWINIHSNTSNQLVTIIYDLPMEGILSWAVSLFFSIRLDILGQKRMG